MAPGGLSHADVVLAHQRIKGAVVATPVLRSPQFDKLAGASVWLKAENLQHIGAFKARGAYNAISQLSDVERRSGLITYSSGNHAQAVAWAAAHFGIKATIFMPSDAPAVKVAAVKRLGSATIVSIGTTSTARQEAAYAFQKAEGGTIIEPFDHPHTIAGQGTVALELRTHLEEQGKRLDQLFVPVGGGGLIAGACLAFAGTNTEIIAVEPESCSSMHQSLAAGKVVPVEPGDTIADGLKPTRVGAMNFAICKERLSGTVLVQDDELGLNLCRLLLWAKTLVEPSGAAALAAAVREARAGAQVGVILSGGNLAPATLSKLLDHYASLC